jgi:hypothetical protein
VLLTTRGSVASNRLSSSSRSSFLGFVPYALCVAFASSFLALITLDLGSSPIGSGQISGHSPLQVLILYFIPSSLILSALSFPLYGWYRRHISSPLAMLIFLLNVACVVVLGLCSVWLWCG